MYKKLYELMLPRVGSKAAKAALVNQYSHVLLVFVGLASVVIAFTGGKRPPLILTSLATLILLAGAVVVYTRMQFARAISEYIGVKVRWYKIPNPTPLNVFDKWLQDLDNKSNK